MTKIPRTPRAAAFKKKVLLEGAESLFEDKKSRRQEEGVDREALEKKVGQLTMENDFLKKTGLLTVEEKSIGSTKTKKGCP